MKSLLLHLSVLLLFSAFSNPTNSTPPPPPAVLDADGHQLQAGSKYHIIPALQSTGGGGGGLALSAKDIPCPFYVMQENIESSLGLPVRFLPADTRHQSVITVTLSNDVNILFNAATICLQSTAWKVGDFDGKTGRRYVMSNGVIGYNNNTGGGGGDSARSLFKIEKAATTAGGAYYKIVYCPSGSSKVLCGDLVRMGKDGLV